MGTINTTKLILNQHSNTSPEQESVIVGEKTFEVVNKKILTTNNISMIKGVKLNTETINVVKPERKKNGTVGIKKTVKNNIKSKSNKKSK